MSENIKYKRNLTDEEKQQKKAALREKIKLYLREMRKNKPNEVKEYRKKYYDEHKDTFQQYYKNHREERLEYQKQRRLAKEPEEKVKDKILASKLLKQFKEGKIMLAE